MSRWTIIVIINGEFPVSVPCQIFISISSFMSGYTRRLYIFSIEGLLAFVCGRLRLRSDILLLQYTYLKYTLTVVISDLFQF